MAGLMVLGISLQVANTAVATFGKQLVRLSQNMKDKADAKKKVMPMTDLEEPARLCSKETTLSTVSSRQRARSLPGFFFKIGIFLSSVVGPLLDAASYACASQSTIAPFAGLAVCWNALLSPLVLKEKQTTLNVIGALLIALGAVICGVCGDHESRTWNVATLLDMLISVRVLLYLLAFLAWFLINRFYLMSWPKGSAVRGLSLGATAGTIAGNMWCVKGALGLLMNTFSTGDWSNFINWLPYLLTLGALFFAVSNIVYLTHGLQEFSGLFIITIFEGSLVCSASMSGIIILREMDRLAVGYIVGYFVGLITILAGTVITFFQELRNNKLRVCKFQDRKSVV